jgi:hypothetical protein
MTIKELKNKYAIKEGYENWYDYLDYCKSNGFNESEIGYDGLIEFCVKYYVTEALQAASEQVEFDEEVLIRQSILQAYPLDLIK